MNKVFPFILDYYDRQVSQMISQKYGYSAMDAYKKFMFSKTYEMLSNPRFSYFNSLMNSSGEMQGTFEFSKSFGFLVTM